MRTATTCFLATLMIGPADDLELPSLSVSGVLAEVVEHHDAGEFDMMIGKAGILLAQAEARGLSEPTMARLHYAIGVGMTHPEEPEGLRLAVPSFQSARALAGPGELRLHATYNIGGVYLAEAERWRLQIPEIAQAQGGPQNPPPQPGAAAGEEEPPDPLEEARKHYRRAKDSLIERLRADWRDADTRANLELIQRRLRELDDIEQQREEQQDQEQQDPNQESEDQENQDENQEQQDGDQQQNSDGEQDDQEEQDPEEQEEPPEEQEKDPGEGQQNNQTEEVPRAPEGQEAAPQQAPPQERLLTREEVMRLLDKLAELEREGQAIEDQIRESRRIPVERDW